MIDNQEIEEENEDDSPVPPDVIAKDFCASVNIDTEILMSEVS